MTSTTILSRLEQLFWFGHSLSRYFNVNLERYTTHRLYVISRLTFLTKTLLPTTPPKFLMHPNLGSKLSPRPKGVQFSNISFILLVVVVSTSRVPNPSTNPGPLPSVSPGRGLSQSFPPVV